MINGLTAQNQQLPQAPGDLARFVLIGREKLAAVKAEIRAIDKLGLAQEVRDQKRGEAQLLSGALLDAEARLGDLLKAIPKATQGNQYTGKMVMCSAAPNQKPKAEIIADLGFSGDQAKRFETLADNRDLIEQVKAEALGNDTLPTRSRVLDLARERARRGQCGETEYYDYLAWCKKTALRYNSAIGNVSALRADQEDFRAWSELLGAGVRESSLRRTEQAIEVLTRVRQFLRGCLT